MSGNYNKVPPPPNLSSKGGESGGEVQDSFADAIAKARAIAAKMQQQHGVPSKQDDPTPRKRGFQDEPSVPNPGYGSTSSSYSAYERDPKRSYYGQEAPPHYGLGSQERYNQTSGTPLAYGQAPTLGADDHSEDFPIPSNLVGLIIGRAGETLKRIQNLSGARVTFSQDHTPTDTERITNVSGTPEAIRTAREMIDQLIRNHFAKGGGMGVAGRGPSFPGSKDVQIPVPGNRVGLIIGKGGETIRDLTEYSGARINVVPDNTVPNGANVERLINISGTDESIERAKALILAIVSGEINTARGSIALQSSLIGIQPGQERVVVKIPNDKVGLVIGRGGETIKYMQQQSRARIVIEVPETDPPPTERCITIVGSPECIESAKALIYEKVDGPGAYASQYESQSGYVGYDYLASMPAIPPYGAYPYYPIGQSYPYQPTPTSQGEGLDKSNSDSTAQAALPEGASAADQEAYANYFKQLNDYYAAYYASLGYAYPHSGTEGQPKVEATTPTQPKAEEKEADEGSDAP